jgi:PrgI family protein
MTASRAGQWKRTSRRRLEKPAFLFLAVLTKPPYNKGMQFQVPQFIETEDKIVGPLSLRQFIYVGIGIGISALLYFVLQTWLWIILSVLFVGGAVAIAFVKVEGRPLAKVILSAAHFYWNPQTYVWQPEHPVVAKGRRAREVISVPPLRKKAAIGEALHKHWEDLQAGKMSDRQFEENKMSERYQIFRKLAGDRQAARRVDYR